MIVVVDEVQLATPSATSALCVPDCPDCHTMVCTRDTCCWPSCTNQGGIRSHVDTGTNRSTYSNAIAVSELVAEYEAATLTGIASHKQGAHTDRQESWSMPHATHANQSTNPSQTIALLACDSFSMCGSHHIHHHKRRFIQLATFHAKHQCTK
jgi:hypothetical protein